jgi:flagellar biosynthesis protein FlhF
MKVKRFVAASAKAALAQVKERLGVDAVILSNRSTPEGVEVLAIAERDMEGSGSVAGLAPTTPAEGFTASFVRPLERAPDRPATRDAPRVAAPLLPESEADEETSDFADAREPDLDLTRAITAEPSAPSAKPRGFSFAQLLRKSAPPPVTPPAATLVNGPRVGPTVQPRAAAPAAPVASATPDVDVMAELRALRGIMEERLKVMNWSDDMRRRPMAASLARELLAAGFSTTLARAATSALPEAVDAKAGRAWLQAKLAAKIAVANAGDDIVERGGVYAITGPTGVGKTTTTAKIAARCVVKYGAASLGLITTDTYRIGAHDQLRVFGKILGVPVHAVHDAAGLEQTLSQLQGKRLVLIDTIGLGQRDERVEDLLTLLDTCRVQRIVLLSATSQIEALEEVVGAYGTSRAGVPAAGAIVTKLDEAVKLGSIVDMLVRHKLFVHFVGVGQRVPEDLALPDRDSLVRSALRVVKNGPFSLTRDEASLVATAAGQAPLFTGDAHA